MRRASLHGTYTVLGGNGKYAGITGPSAGGPPQPQGRWCSSTDPARPRK
jgi:hypothetical protein